MNCLNWWKNNFKGSRIECELIHKTVKRAVFENIFAKKKKKTIREECSIFHFYKIIDFFYSEKVFVM